MENTAMWAFWTDALKILGPALITGIISYMLGKNQFKIKKLEIQGESEFKARELMFNYYLNQIETSRMDTKSFSESIGGALGNLVGMTDDEGLDKMYELLGPIVETEYSHSSDEIRILESDIVSENLLDDALIQKFKIVKDFNKINPSDIKREERLNYLLNWVLVRTSIHSIQDVLVENKMEKLFKNFINK